MSSTRTIIAIPRELWKFGVRRVRLHTDPHGEMLTVLCDLPIAHQVVDLLDERCLVELGPAKYIGHDVEQIVSIRQDTEAQ